MITETDWSRLAMAIDCEGCVAVVKHKSSSSRVGYIHSLRLQITNTEFNLIDWANSVFGGSIFSRLNVSRKRYFTLVFNGEEAARILTGVLPYLLVKSKQAKTALEFQSTMNCGYRPGNPVPDSVIAVREQLFLSLKEQKIVPVEV